MLIYRNDSLNEDEEDLVSYTLTFTLSFPHAKDTVYLAHCFPYRFKYPRALFRERTASPTGSCIKLTNAHLFNNCLKGIVLRVALLLAPTAKFV